MAIVQIADKPTLDAIYEVVKNGNFAGSVIKSIQYGELNTSASTTTTAPSSSTDIEIAEVNPDKTLVLMQCTLVGEAKYSSSQNTIHYGSRLKNISADKITVSTAYTVSTNISGNGYTYQIRPCTWIAIEFY